VGLQTVLKNLVREGDLTIKLPGGSELRLGDGSGPPLVARVTTAAWAARIAAKPGLGVGEAYMDGGLVLEQGGIDDFIDLIGANAKNKTSRRGPFRRWLRKTLREANDRVAARRNVAHHYDLSYDLYRRFLDEDMQYSCAYFERPDMTLEEAQLAKKRHIAAKLHIRPGQSVVEIGCGWGGLALQLVEDTPDVEVDAITLSVEQLKVAQARAEAKGLAHKARFSLTDYRDLKGTYDRVLSVAMFEAVGRPNYQEYFDGVARLMKDDGVALIHSIGKMHGPGATNAFTQKYIFPGGYIPGLSEIVTTIERAGLWITDIEILRLHYAETCRIWRERFMADPDIPQMFDERFRRMWEFYLAGAELGFRHGGHMVFQIQLAKKRDAVPLTRDYLLSGSR